jgi:hypothetical protein
MRPVISLPSSQDNSAALQSAVWEVVNETTTSYGFTTGSFKASSTTGSTQAALTALDAIWANLGHANGHALCRPIAFANQPGLPRHGCRFLNPSPMPCCWQVWELSVLSLAVAGPQKRDHGLAARPHREVERSWPSGIARFKGGDGYGGEPKHPGSCNSRHCLATPPAAVACRYQRHCS